MVGYSVTAADINNKAGQLVTSLWDNLLDVNRFHRWLADANHTDDFLNAAGITGTTAAGDVKTLRDAFADLGGTGTGLWAVSRGLHVPASAKNFFASAKELTGTTYTG